MGERRNRQRIELDNCRLVRLVAELRAENRGLRRTVRGLTDALADALVELAEPLCVSTGGRDRQPDSAQPVSSGC